jgi:hypothetical protein
VSLVADKPFDPDDPLELVGVAVPSGADALERMARCLVEEYLREGWDEPRLLALFRNPFFRTVHVIYQIRGEEYVKGLIAQVAAQWGVWRTAEEGVDADA